MSWKFCVPSGGSQEESISCFFLLLQAACIFWFLALHLSDPRLCHHISCFLILFPPFFVYIGPAQITQENLPISKALT